MKTLEQYIIKIFGKHKVLLHEGNITKFTIEAVKEWLQEHQEEANDRYAIGEATIIQGLIEELEQ